MDFWRKGKRKLCVQTQMCIQRYTYSKQKIFFPFSCLASCLLCACHYQHSNKTDVWGTQTFFSSEWNVTSCLTISPVFFIQQLSDSFVAEMHRSFTAGMLFNNPFFQIFIRCCVEVETATEFYSFVLLFIGRLHVKRFLGSVELASAFQRAEGFFFWQHKEKQFRNSSAFDCLERVCGTGSTNLISRRYT